MEWFAIAYREVCRQNEQLRARVAELEESAASNRAKTDVVIGDIVAARDTALAALAKACADNAALRAALGELTDAAKAYREMCACYRIGKQPTEELFERLEKAAALL